MRRHYNPVWARGKYDVLLCGLGILWFNDYQAVHSDELMADKRNSQSGWTQAERDAFRKLLRMGLILLLVIVIAGAAAALLGSALGTL